VTWLQRLHRRGLSGPAMAAKVTAEAYRSRTGAAVSKSTVARLLRG
jgi:hypothetical protein